MEGQKISLPVLESPLMSQGDISWSSMLRAIVSSAERWGLTLYVIEKVKLRNRLESPLGTMKPLGMSTTDASDIILVFTLLRVTTGAAVMSQDRPR